MGDDRHKKPPTDDVEEIVTPEFRRLVLATLDANRRRNKLHRRAKSDAEYLISNRPELAAALGSDKTMMNKLLGPVKSTTKVKLVETSTFVRRIEELLGLPRTVSIAVPQSRAETLKLIASVSDAEFSEIAAAYKRR